MRTLTPDAAKSPSVPTPGGVHGGTRGRGVHEVQGLGAVSGTGVELVITLGTGFGSALFADGRPCAHLELGHHEFRKGRTYEEALGDRALAALASGTAPAGPTAAPAGGPRFRAKFEAEVRRILRRVRAEQPSGR